MSRGRDPLATNLNQFDLIRSSRSTARRPESTASSWSIFPSRRLDPCLRCATSTSSPLCPSSPRPRLTSVLRLFQSAFLSHGHFSARGPFTGHQRPIFGDNGSEANSSLNLVHTLRDTDSMRLNQNCQPKQCNTRPRFNLSAVLLALDLPL